eukprot:354770-Chlamydomonas_euryale.AAC.2
MTNSPATLAEACTRWNSVWALQTAVAADCIAAGHNGITHTRCMELRLSIVSCNSWLYIVARNAWLTTWAPARTSLTALRHQKAAHCVVALHPLVSD